MNYIGRFVCRLIAQTVINYVYFCITANVYFWKYDAITESYPLTAKLELIAFTFCIFQVQLNFFTALFRGPGFVPKGWRPENPAYEQFLQYCKQCDAFKAPRSHHCRRSNRCVLKMDHYCPWIGNCVGHFNHAYFLRFLIFVPLSCLWSLWIVCWTTYDQIYTPWHSLYDMHRKHYVVFNSTALMCNFICFGASLGTFIAVTFLMYQQLKVILSNRTSIEYWIEVKAGERERCEEEPPFLFPYDLGKWGNWKEVMGWHGFKFQVTHPGLDTWPLRDGCGQYTLTVEQLAQKAFKRAMSRNAHVVKPYTGWWTPMLAFGCRTGCINVPKTDETRLSIAIGDRIAVTRIWGTRWWYGAIFEFADKTRDPKTEPRSNVRGWFPSIAVRLEELAEEQSEEGDQDDGVAVSCGGNIESREYGDVAVESKKTQ